MTEGTRNPVDERGEQSSLDLLENEDRRILQLTKELQERSGTAVIDSADYGNRAKLLVRHFAVREAALMDVVDGLRQVPELGELADRFAGDLGERRVRMDAVEKCSRNVQGLYLNTGQDFDSELSGLISAVRPEMEWDLAEGVATARRALAPARLAELLHSAEHVARHAPTNVSPTGPKWWERAPVVSRLVTVVHHLRDYPRATRDART